MSVPFSSHIGYTGKRLPSLSVGPPRIVSVVGCLLMSALSCRRYVRHTYSLHDETRLEIQASLCFHDLSIRAVCLLHSPSQIAADYYYNQYQRRHANRYIVFADMSVQ